jgi:hypothetical protein
MEKRLTTLEVIQANARIEGKGDIPEYATSEIG